MSGQHTPESVVEAIRPSLDAFTKAAEPFCRKAAEDIYERLLDTVQDYLRENGEWNIGEDIRRCRRIETDNYHLRVEIREIRDTLIGLTDILNRAESNASGNPEWEIVSERINRARRAITRATPE